MHLTETFFHHYLFGYIFWLNLTLGMFGLTLLHHTIRGSYGYPMLRILEAGGGPVMLFVMGLGLIPILLNAHDVYPWANQAMVNADPILKHRAAYLNMTGIVERAIFYFAIWILFAFLLKKWSLQQDKTGDFRFDQRRSNLAAPGIVMYVLTVSFAFTDWVMALDTHWYSTIYGAWFVVGQSLAAMAFVSIYIMTRAKQQPYSAVVNPQLTRDFGNLMLTMVMVWAYFSFSQFLIQWSGNLPAEIAYYYNRSLNGWRVIGTTLIVFQFFAPFLILLSSRVKRTPAQIVQVAVLLMAMRVLDVFWIVVPAYRPNLIGNLGSIGLDAVMLALIGVVWFLVFNWQIKLHALIPAHQPRVQEVLEHEHA